MEYGGRDGRGFAMAERKNSSNRDERREWSRLQRRERIIDRAEKVFFKKGVEQSTLDEVAKSSGYTIQNLYLYFKNKEDLFAAVLLRGLIVLSSAMEKAYRESGTGLEKIEAMGREFFAFFLQRGEYSELNMRFERNYYAYHRKHSRKKHGDYIMLCQREVDRNSDLMIEAVKIGLKDGSITTSLDPKHVMLLLWAQSLGMVQVISMRRKYFADVYGLTTEQFLSSYANSVRTYLSRGGDR